MANVTLKNGKFIGAFMHNGHRQRKSFDTLARPRATGSAQRARRR